MPSFARASAQTFQLLQVSCWLYDYIDIILYIIIVMIKSETASPFSHRYGEGVSACLSNRSGYLQGK